MVQAESEEEPVSVTVVLQAHTIIIADSIGNLTLAQAPIAQTPQASSVTQASRSKDFTSLII